MESFDALLAEANDFDLCDGTFKLIGDRYHHWVDASRYSPEERVVMLVWHASGIIDNGGFEYLFSGDFEGDPDFPPDRRGVQDRAPHAGLSGIPGRLRLVP